ncbi:MAG: Calx-beta domain-containing protein [Verrucomicrobiota bacterium]
MFFRTGLIHVTGGLCLPMALLADDLMPLGDEFNDATTFAQWQDLGVVEGWVTPSYEEADIDTTTAGRFRIQPGALTWFAHLRGLLMFKEVDGDFVATTRLRVLSRHNPGDPTEVPNRSFSLTGIFAHQPRTIVSAAPTPYTTDPVLPGTNGSDYVANTENYIFLSYGSAGNPGTRQFEIKATRNSNSLLYFDSNGIDQNETEVWLQMVRIGDTVVCLRKHSQGGNWIVENRYPNADHPFPDFGTTLQVGITAYTDWPTASPYNSGGLNSSFHFNYAPPAGGNPDLVSEVDYFRFQRPDASIDEADLQAMSVSYDPATNVSANPPVLLSASPGASPYLGDNANVELGLVGAPASISVNELDGTATITLTRSGANTDEAMTLAYTVVSDTAAAGIDVSAVSGTVEWAASDSLSKDLVLPLIADDLPEGEERLELAFEVSSGPAMVGPGVPMLTELVIGDHPFEAWIWNLYAGSPPPGSTGVGDDPDGNGFGQLFEYALEPGSALLGGQLTALDAPGAGGAAHGLRFAPRSEGIRLTVQRSTDLDQWDDLARIEDGGDWQILEPGTTIDEPAEGVSGTTLVSPPATSEPVEFLRLMAEKL